MSAALRRVSRERVTTVGAAARFFVFFVCKCHLDLFYLGNNGFTAQTVSTVELLKLSCRNGGKKNTTELRYPDSPGGVLSDQKGIYNNLGYCRYTHAHTHTHTHACTHTANTCTLNIHRHTHTYEDAHTRTCTCAHNK